MQIENTANGKSRIESNKDALGLYLKSFSSLNEQTVTAIDSKNVKLEIQILLLIKEGSKVFIGPC